ncbi:tyrosine-type recombinase/integrase [Wukongibacter baidiensis]|uniref:tyrosine-type recombinase/integrase n=1 Tax=Wukongibacter baidiensis TaxID=1723361 RepID=UPI003D7F788F
MLLHEAIEKFKQYLITMDKSTETIRSYMSDLCSFEYFLEKKHNCPLYIDEIQTEDIEDYLYWLKEKRALKAVSRSRNLYTIRSFWKYTHNKGLCPRNITVSLEPIRSQKKERTYLSIDEADQFIGAIKHSLIKVVAQTLYYTGMRISECLNLKLMDVDIDNQIIHVINGKGKKDRQIPISKNLLTIFKNYLDNLRPKVDSNNFFATKKTGRLSSTYVNRVFQEITLELGWKKRVTAHILRHSFASNLIKNGVNLVHVQKLLGHSNLKVTSVYTHANMDDLSEAINVL